jgi:hypothetical protein
MVAHYRVVKIVEIQARAPNKVIRAQTKVGH